MSEEQSNRDKDIELKEAKKVAYYSALIDAWIHTRMERDKSLLSLSAGGIALLVTLLTTIGTKNYIETTLYFLALLSFLATVIVCLVIFKRNSKHLKEVASGDRSKDSVLERLDYFSFWSFIIGVLLAIAVGVASWGSKVSK